MKNFLFIILCLSMAFTIQAQDDRKTEQRIHQLTETLVQIQNSRTSTNVKSERVYQVIKQYLSSNDTRSLHADLELREVLDGSGIKNDEKMRKEREGVINCISQSLTKKSGDNGFVSCCSGSGMSQDECERTRRAMKAVAVKNLADPKIHCKSGNCDLNDDIRTKSRGVEDLWVYQGERKFFNERDMFGWRYKCVKMSPKDYDSMTKMDAEAAGDNASIEEGEEREGNLENDMIFIQGDPRGNDSGRDISWKKEENVDRW